MSQPTATPGSGVESSRATSLQTGINSRRFAEFLTRFITTAGDDAARRVALEAVMASVANMVLSMREHRVDTERSANILTEPTYMRAALLNLETGIQEMRNPWGFTEKLTGHPTSGLDLPTIQKIHELENYLSGLDKEGFQRLVTFASLGSGKAVKGQFPELAAKVKAVEDHFTPATKLSPSGETERASYFGKQRFDAIPELLIRQDRVHRAFSDNKGDEQFYKTVKVDFPVEPRDPAGRKERLDAEAALPQKKGGVRLRPVSTVPLAELDRQERLLECLSWQGDRDSKPNVTARVIEEAVHYNTAKTHEWYVSELEQLAKGIDARTALQSDRTGVEARQSAKWGAEAAKEVRELQKFSNAAELRQKLRDIKEKYETKGYHFPALEDKNGMFTRYSKLDALYVQVVNAGDCYPKIEMRQNATMHRNVLNHVLKLYANKAEWPHAVIAGEYVKALEKLNGSQQLSENEVRDLNDKAVRYTRDFLGAAKTDADFGLLIRGKVAEYESEVTNFYRLKNSRDKADQDKAQALEKNKDFKERLEFYETLKGWELTTKYPEAIKSYVIAETGVLHNEQKIVEGMKSRTQRRTYVADKAGTDVFTAMMFKYLVTPIEERQANSNKKLTQIIPLLETRGAITAAEVMLNRLYTDTNFQEYAKNSYFSAPPQVYDQATNGYRTVKVAEIKKMLGLTPGGSDFTTDVKSTLCVKFAGSDSMRENGICIGPMNSHNQEAVQLKAIRSGYWVEIDQGVGGAVHRSNPAAFGVSRATTGQGAANHYFTSDAIANRVESHHAAHMMLRSGHKLDMKKYRHVAAVVPGHLGNTLMFPLESDEFRKETYKPLNEGCKAHASMFDDKNFDEFMKKASGLEFTKWFNFSARPAARQDREFSASSLRAIGYNLSLFTMGANTTLWKGMGEFLGMTKDGDVNMRQTKRFIQESPKIQDMMTRAIFGMALADYDTAWKFQNAQRSVEPQNEPKDQEDSSKEKVFKVFISKEGVGKASLEEIAEGKKPEFGVEAQVLAKMDLEFHNIGKAILTAYSELQGRPANQLKYDLLGGFKPELMLKIMPPEMRAEVKNMKNLLDEARQYLVNVRNDPFFEEFKAADKERQKIMELNSRYRKAENAFRAIAETLESGTHESLNRISHTFNNQFVLTATNPSRGGLKEAMKDKAPQYQIAG